MITGPRNLLVLSRGYPQAAWRRAFDLDETWNVMHVGDAMSGFQWDRIIVAPLALISSDVERKAQGVWLTHLSVGRGDVVYL